MRELFEQVMDLQNMYSSQNTPEMITRGKLIREAIPTEIRRWRAAQSAAVIPFRGVLGVQGKDGTGLKTFVPWVRIYSPQLSPSAQKGWYAVYLFREDGKGVALCISHGSTTFNGREFIPRPPGEAASLMQWGSGVIGLEAQTIGMQVGVDLGSREQLSRAYEQTTAFSKTYPRDAIPADEVLARDAELAMGLVGQLYRAQELGKAPYSDPPEVEEAEQAAAQVARPSSRISKGGQGFGLTAAERSAVEKHAMDHAFSWLSNNGFTDVKDVHATNSCDFTGKRGGVDHSIEVKGTTSSLGKIVLTANEVSLHKSLHPATVLIVVHDIELRELRTQAMGGSLTVFDPFVIENCVLRPLSYVCELPSLSS